MTSHTILLVEDNPATRKMVSFVLSKRGHRVLEAPDGATALALMEREQPVLVLQDVILPDIDGFDLVGQLRQRARGQLAVLAFSGFTSHNDEARIAAVGFDDVIVKPIEPSRLVPLVEAHLPSPVVAADRFGRGRRLVIADDDPVQLKLTRFRFEKLGFAVETANDGQQALEMIGRSAPDAIVSDVLMPNLDGFGLALAVRQDPKLQTLPLLLVTSSYVDDSDRDLAHRAGANDLVLRTPEQRELVQALRSILEGPPPPAPTGRAGITEVEIERTRRVVRQLERHVVMNAGLARRCSALAAELAVLTGISEAVLKQQDVESALDQALASCFDAGGISVGALYLTQSDGSLRVRPLGSKVTWTPGDIETFFGNEPLLRQIVAGRAKVILPSPGLPEAPVRDVLRRAQANAAMVVPLVHVDQQIGALFMVAQAQELDQDDWQVFAQGVGNQIAQALALAGAFAQRQAAERQALESRAEWQALSQNAPDTIARIDCDGIVQFTNRLTAAEPAGQVLGEHWLARVPAESRESLTAALDAVLSKGESSTHEIMLPGGDGNADWFSIRISPIQAAGLITGAVLIGRQITEQKQQEAQLIVSDRMASVGTLAAGVAHEINNPLAALMANLELAQRESVEMAERFGTNDLVEYLRDAHEAAERVRLIVRDLKIFSRSEQDRLGPTDLRAVLESTLRMAWNEIRHRARLVKDFAPVPPVEANESRLGQVFLNLIINAAHAIAEGNAKRNEIRVSTRVDAGGMVAVDITDTGSGMTDEVRGRLFTPFFTTKPLGVGTGLGLSISQRIVSAMKGQIHVRSTLGEGSTFTVLLPAATMGATKVPVEAAPVPAPASRRGRVLVIDDEQMIAMAVQRSLGKDHDVVYAGGAQEALARLEAGEKFDVILCDLMMPEMTGMDLHERLLQSAPEQARRMIFVTGGAFTDRARAFLEAVPNLRLEKPFNVQQLRAIVVDRVR